MKCIFNSYCSCPLQWPVHGLDVVAALDWIYDNIAQYGGDPRQVGNGLCVFVTPSGCCLMASLIFRFFAHCCWFSLPLSRGCLLVYACAFES